MASTTRFTISLDSNPHFSFKKLLQKREEPPRNSPEPVISISPLPESDQPNNERSLAEGSTEARNSAEVQKDSAAASGDEGTKKEKKPDPLKALAPKLPAMNSSSSSGGRFTDMIARIERLCNPSSKDYVGLDPREGLDLDDAFIDDSELDLTVANEHEEETTIEGFFIAESSKVLETQKRKKAKLELPPRPPNPSQPKIKKQKLSKSDDEVSASGGSQSGDSKANNKKKKLLLLSKSDDEVSAGKSNSKPKAAAKKKIGKISQSDNDDEDIATDDSSQPRKKQAIKATAVSTDISSDVSVQPGTASVVPEKKKSTTPRPETDLAQAEKKQKTHDDREAGNTSEAKKDEQGQTGEKQAAQSSAKSDTAPQSKKAKLEASPPQSPIDANKSSKRPTAKEDQSESINSSKPSSAAQDSSTNIKAKKTNTATLKSNEAVVSHNTTQSPKKSLPTDATVSANENKGQVIEEKKAKPIAPSLSDSSSNANKKATKAGASEEKKPSFSSATAAAGDEKKSKALEDKKSKGTVGGDDSKKPSAKGSEEKISKAKVLEEKKSAASKDGGGSGGVPASPGEKKVKAKNAEGESSSQSTAAEKKTKDISEFPPPVVAAIKVFKEKFDAVFAASGTKRFPDTIDDELFNLYKVFLSGQKQSGISRTDFIAHLTTVIPFKRSTILQRLQKLSATNLHDKAPAPDQAMSEQLNDILETLRQQVKAVVDTPSTGAPLHEHNTAPSNQNSPSGEESGTPGAPVWNDDIKHSVYQAMQVQADLLNKRNEQVDLPYLSTGWEMKSFYQQLINIWPKGSVTTADLKKAEKDVKSAMKRTSM
mmetsp:Transcript_40226/g.65184  ORF Transcript_40226/g.65184 Transcript_40226/m.65184 type:complete len:823 (+) Transcript_40226:92-2560(+)